MKLVDPDGFHFRDPTRAELRRVALTSRGPHDEWSGDGHDKLVKYGFAIWGMRDKWSGYWLGLWVLPNNRLGVVIAWLYLSIVRDVGGETRTIDMSCQVSVGK